MGWSANLPCKGPKMVKDKGYVWLILVMSFLSHFLHVGYSFGIIGNLTIAHKQYFNINIQQSGLIGSIHSGLFFMFGPISSVVVKKLGCRITEMMGGACLIICYGFSSLSSQTWHAFLLYSVLAAFGVSLVYAASTEILALHFEKRKYLAFSIAVTGSFVAMVVWPIASQYLLSTLGYSKTMGILSSFHVTHVIAGSLFFPPSSETDSATDSSFSSASAEAIKYAPQIREAEKASGEKEEVADKGFHNLALDVSQEEFGAPSADIINPEASEKSVEKNTLKVDFLILLKSPKVWALLLNGMLWNANVSSFFILINDYIFHSTGMSKENISLGITILGIMNIVGCVMIICTSSLKFERLILHFSGTMIHSICTIIIAFANGKTMFYIMTGLWGLGQGICIGNLVGAISTFCDVQQLAVLFGLHLLAEGIGGLAAAPICSAIAAVAGDAYGIVFSGCLGVVGSCCILPVLMSRLCSKKRDVEKI